MMNQVQRQVLVDLMGIRLKQLPLEKAGEFGLGREKIETRPDHFNLFLSTGPSPAYGNSKSVQGAIKSVSVAKEADGWSLNCEVYNTS